MPIDYKKYPENWKAEIVPRILKRANNKCEFCFLENKQFVWKNRVYCKTENGNFGYRTIWFSNIYDAYRFKSKFFPKKIKVVLTIAHLDHDESNHTVEDSRLKALCQYCHLNYDQKEKLKRHNTKEKADG